MDKPEKYFVITIDTEADHSPDWRKSDPLAFRSVTCAIPERLERLFKKYGAVGTYLLTAEVLEDGESVRTIKALKRPFELGTHLHPEFVAPEKKYHDYAGVRAKEFSCNLTPELEKMKIESITRLFYEKIGYPPTAYRGGKFAFGENTAQSLIAAGYRVDTSVTPRVSWRSALGPDFRNYPDQPYFIAGVNNPGRLLEVPVTISYTDIIGRVLNRPVWLRPSFNGTGQMRCLIDNFLRRANVARPVIFNMMFHSMEFFPGASPYGLSEKDCDELLRRTENIIRYCTDKGVRFLALTELADIYEGEKCHS